MSDKPIKTRFAPSPTGYLHLGNARTALFNALLARKSGGVFVLRIEDTDRSRSRDKYRRAIEEDLRWLGMAWDEGPGANSSRGPYLQSQRGDLYKRHYDALIDSGRAYACYCTPQELKASRKAQLAAGRPPRYVGTCAALSADESGRRRDQGIQPSLRFRVPTGEIVDFDDLVRGSQRYHSDLIGDFVIRRSDSSPAFFFSNAVDDAEMGVTHVLRGEDHLSNTPRQLMVLKALNYPPPAYGHITLLLEKDGAPLSKRHGAGSLRDLRETGYLPQAVNNYLARLGHVYERAGYLSPDELVEGFDLARLSRAPGRFDESQLRHWQREAIRHASDRALWDWLAARSYPESERPEDRVPDEMRMAFMRAIRDNIEVPIEALKLARDLFAELPEYSGEAEDNIRAAGEHFFAAALERIAHPPADFAAYARSVGASAGVKGKALFMPLRAALTGETHGPEMARLFPLIGVDRARARLREALRIASDR